MAIWLSLSDKLKQFEPILVKSSAMKIFQSFRVLFEPLGIGQAFKNDGINSRNVVALSFLTFWTSFSYAFFLSAAEKTFSEFIQSFYISITTMINTLILAIVVWKKSKIYKFIDDLEVLIEIRKLIPIIYFKFWLVLIKE